MALKLLDPWGSNWQWEHWLLNTAKLNKRSAKDVLPGSFENKYYWAPTRTSDMMLRLPLRWDGTTTVKCAVDPHCKGPYYPNAVVYNGLYKGCQIRVGRDTEIVTHETGIRVVEDSWFLVTNISDTIQSDGYWHITIANPTKKTIPDHKNYGNGWDKLRPENNDVKNSFVLLQGGGVKIASPWYMPAIAGMGHLSSLVKSVFDPQDYVKQELHPLHRYLNTEEQYQNVLPKALCGIWRWPYYDPQLPENLETPQLTATLNAVSVEGLNVGDWISEIALESYFKVNSITQTAPTKRATGTDYLVGFRIDSMSMNTLLGRGRINYWPRRFDDQNGNPIPGIYTANVTYAAGVNGNQVPVGTGSFKFEAATKRLSWRMPGDTEYGQYADLSGVSAAGANVSLGSYSYPLQGFEVHVVVYVAPLEFGAVDAEVDIDIVPARFSWHAPQVQFSGIGVQAGAAQNNAVLSDNETLTFPVYGAFDTQRTLALTAGMTQKQVRDAINNDANIGALVKAQIVQVVSGLYAPNSRLVIVRRNDVPGADFKVVSNKTIPTVTAPTAQTSVLAATETLTFTGTYPSPTCPVAQTIVLAEGLTQAQVVSTISGTGLCTASIVGGKLTIVAAVGKFTIVSDKAAAVDSTGIGVTPLVSNCSTGIGTTILTSTYTSTNVSNPLYWDEVEVPEYDVPFTLYELGMGGSITCSFRSLRRTETGLNTRSILPVTIFNSNYDVVVDNPANITITGSSSLTGANQLPLSFHASVAQTSPLAADETLTFPAVGGMINEANLSITLTAGMSIDDVIAAINADVYLAPYVRASKINGKLVLSSVGTTVFSAAIFAVISDKEPAVDSTGIGYDLYPVWAGSASVPAQTAVLAQDETLVFVGRDDSLFLADASILLTAGMTQTQVVSAINADPTIGALVLAANPNVGITGLGGYLKLTAKEPGFFQVYSTRAIAANQTGIGTTWLTSSTCANPIFTYSLTPVATTRLGTGTLSWDNTVKTWAWAAPYSTPVRRIGSFSATAPTSQTGALAAQEVLTFSGTLFPTPKTVTLTAGLTQAQVVSAINANNDVKLLVVASAVGGRLVISSNGGFYTIVSDKAAAATSTGWGTNPITASIPSGGSVSLALPANDGTSLTAVFNYSRLPPEDRTMAYDLSFDFFTTQALTSFDNVPVAGNAYDGSTEPLMGGHVMMQGRASVPYSPTPGDKFALNTWFNPSHGWEGWGSDTMPKQVDGVRWPSPITNTGSSDLITEIDVTDAHQFRTIVDPAGRTSMDGVQLWSGRTWRPISFSSGLTVTGYTYPTDPLAYVAGMGTIRVYSANSRTIDCTWTAPKVNQLDQVAGPIVSFKLPKTEVRTSAAYTVIAGTAQTGPLAVGETLTFPAFGLFATAQMVVLTAGMTQAQVVTAINTKMMALGITLYADVSNGKLMLSSTAGVFQVISSVAAGATSSGVGTAYLTSTTFTVVAGTAQTSNLAAAEVLTFPAYGAMFTQKVVSLANGATPAAVVTAINTGLSGTGVSAIRPTLGPNANKLMLYSITGTFQVQSDKAAASNSTGIGTGLVTSSGAKAALGANETLTFPAYGIFTTQQTITLTSGMTLSQYVAAINADPNIGPYISASESIGTVVLTTADYGMGLFRVYSDQIAAPDSTGIGRTSGAGGGIIGNAPIRTSSWITTGLANELFTLTGDDTSTVSLKIVWAQFVSNVPSAAPQNGLLLTNSLDLSAESHYPIDMVRFDPEPIDRKDDDGKVVGGWYKIVNVNHDTNKIKILIPPGKKTPSTTICPTGTSSTCLRGRLQGVLPHATTIHYSQRNIQSSLWNHLTEMLMACDDGIDIYPINLNMGGAISAGTNDDDYMVKFVVQQLRNVYKYVIDNGMIVVNTFAHFTPDDYSLFGSTVLRSNLDDRIIHFRGTGPRGFDGFSSNLEKWLPNPNKTTSQIATESLANPEVCDTLYADGTQGCESLGWGPYISFGFPNSGINFLGRQSADSNYRCDLPTPNGYVDIDIAEWWRRGTGTDLVPESNMDVGVCMWNSGGTHGKGSVSTVGLIVEAYRRKYGIRIPISELRRIMTKTAWTNIWPTTFAMFVRDDTASVKYNPTALNGNVELFDGSPIPAGSGYPGTTFYDHYLDINPGVPTQAGYDVGGTLKKRYVYVPNMRTDVNFIGAGCVNVGAAIDLIEQGG